MYSLFSVCAPDGVASVVVARVIEKKQQQTRRRGRLGPRTRRDEQRVEIQGEKNKGSCQKGKNVGDRGGESFIFFFNIDVLGVESQYNGYVLWLKCLQEQPATDDTKKDTNVVENAAGEITEGSKKDEGLKDTVSNFIHERLCE